MAVSKVRITKGRVCIDGTHYDTFLRIRARDCQFSFCIKPAITSGLPSGTVCEADTDGDSTGAYGAPPAAASDDDDGGESDGEPARPRTRRTSRRVAAPLPAHPLRTAAPLADHSPRKVPPSEFVLWKIDTVLQQYPVSRSTWYQGIKEGKHPKPVRIGARAVAWRSAEVLALIESLQTV